MYHASFGKGSLVAGLNGFYASYIASEGDNEDLEEAECSTDTAWFACVRPEFRGAVLPPSPSETTAIDSIDQLWLLDDWLLHC